ncbi:protein tyrosine kinase domain-containing protein [Rhizoctonia solani AG-1 IA]|uniref:Protein tyrosine kinase domain-containing protein n=1 Tax=Thanatephorus cucumeris (strain AG1-IA) TaxID=983506 RepID=L8WCI7_THACA|nr:protein tyrosine kinase domain-containing protein [Rhizoctonia solani AG-1 IA]
MGRIVPVLRRLTGSAIRTSDHWITNSAQRLATMIPDVTAELDRIFTFSDLYDNTCYSSRLSDNTRVTIKTYKPASSVNKQDKMRQKKLMQDMASAWAECRHPNIVELVGRATFKKRPAVVFKGELSNRILYQLRYGSTIDPYELVS